MDPSRAIVGMSHQRRAFVIGGDRGERGGRPPMRPAFGGRGRGGDFHKQQFGSRGGGGAIPTMQYGRFPASSNLAQAQANSQNRGGGRGICIRGSNMQMSQLLPNVRGTRGGTDISGRGAPLTYTAQNYPIQNPSISPYSMIIPPPPPICGQQPWNGSLSQQQMVFDPRSQGYMPSMYQQMPYLPQGYNNMPPLAPHAVAPYPLSVQWQQDAGTTYYDPSRGYFTDDSVNSVSDQTAGSFESLSYAAPDGVSDLQQKYLVPLPQQQEWEAYSSNEQGFSSTQQAPEPIAMPAVPLDLVHYSSRAKPQDSDFNISQDNESSSRHIVETKPSSDYHSCPTHNRKPELSTDSNSNMYLLQQRNEMSNIQKNSNLYFESKFSTPDAKQTSNQLSAKEKDNKPIQTVGLQQHFVPKPFEDNNNYVPSKAGCTVSRHSDMKGAPRRYFKGHQDAPQQNSGELVLRKHFNGSGPQRMTGGFKVEESVAAEATTTTNQTAEIDFDKMNKMAEDYRRSELAKMMPIIKNVYLEDPSVARMTPNEIKEIRELKNNITVAYVEADELSPLAPIIKTDSSGERSPIPNPVTSFDQCFRNFPEIMDEIAKQGFTEPSPIQCQLWPCIMKGLDVVGIAQTGSGKTLAFLLPALLHIERQTTPRDKRNSPTVLVLAPTRELAQQIDKEVKKYRYRNIRSVCLYGGGNRQDQIEAISEQTEIVIATPGRLNDLVQAEKLNLKEVSMLILDEADEMLDQGFEPQINKALLKVRGDRQTILTSATWPASVRRMAQNYTNNPVMVVVGTMDLRAVTTVKQNIVFIEAEDKFNWVVNFIRNMNPIDKAIVFVSTKSMADHISSELSLMDIAVQCIHGALSQCDREQAIADMQSGLARILIATDIAARGIDIDNVTHIINHDFPRTVEQYVHRIGRTGRAGRTGESHTFIVRQDWASAKQLIEILQHAKQEVPQELREMAERFSNRRERGGGRGRGGGRVWEDRRGGAAAAAGSGDQGGIVDPLGGMGTSSGNFWDSARVWESSGRCGGGGAWEEPRSGGGRGRRGAGGGFRN